MGQRSEVGDRSGWKPRCEGGVAKVRAGVRYRGRRQREVAAATEGNVEQHSCGEGWTSGEWRVKGTNGEQRSGIGAEPTEKALLDLVKLIGRESAELAEKKFSGK